MKKIIAWVLSLILGLSLVGCNSSDITQENEPSSSTPALLTCSTAHHIGKNPDLEITNEQAKAIITVWDNSLWESDITKTAYDFVFRGNNIEVRYCYDEGIFNDVINEKHTVLSEKVKNQVNEIIDKFIVSPIIN